MVFFLGSLDGTFNGKLDTIVTIDKSKLTSEFRPNFAHAHAEDI